MLASSRTWIPAMAAALALAFATMNSSQDVRHTAKKAMKDGNFKEAYEGFRKLALDPRDDVKLLPEDLQNGIDCLRRLSRIAEEDAFREAVVTLHPKSWRVRQAAARSLLGGTRWGWVISGEFHRGPHRGGGRYVSVAERDRARALQMLAEGLPTVATSADREAAAGFYFELARVLLDQRQGDSAWQLQEATALDGLPDFEDRWGGGRGSQGAPVDAAGKPVFHALPESFEGAKSDGERWRWALRRAGEADPSRKPEAGLIFARFLHGQFGVQTMAQGAMPRFDAPDEKDGEKTGVFALHTLAENETIARLATGVARFELPKEFDFISILRALAASKDDDAAAPALDLLGQIFENRRQYPEAAAIWAQAIETAGPGQEFFRVKRRQQIIGKWGRFDGAATFPAGRGPELGFVFRNGTRLKLEARAIRVEALLDDVKSYIKKARSRVDWREVNLGNIGYRILHEGGERYLEKKPVARWDLELEPRAGHFDRRVTVATPLQKAGAYLLTAEMADGNTSNIALWVADTAIIQKPMNGQGWYFIADAVSGKPVPGANLELFGYRVVRPDRRSTERRVETTHFAEVSGADGQVEIDREDLADRYQWLATARTNAGRFAWLGFDRVWIPKYDVTDYDRIKVYAITSQPVYRPGQEVKYKLWVRRATYAEEKDPAYAGKKFRIEIHDPKGQKIFSDTMESDAYGGIEGDITLPADATLGRYRIGIPKRGQGYFRVEEYKKPEYEVVIKAPTEPVSLGDKIEATIEARYFFGAPVTDAKVTYTVYRTSLEETWFPKRRWDWLYGPGYWWFAYDASWYPGWGSWRGCVRPTPTWWWKPNVPPEVVARSETKIGADGTVKVTIDTAAAKELHGDKDHSYRIVAEVVDASRRTITGEGAVKVAREPFRVYCWVDRGYYRVGDTIEAAVAARTIDGNGVKGKGRIELHRITYDAKKQPVETVVAGFDVETGADGQVRQKLVASQAGQYRVVAMLTDAKGNKAEGGYLLTVIGEGFDASAYRFNHLELIPDKESYQPGETIKLQINTDRPESTVLLFLRPVNGVYLPPQVLKLSGKSTIVDIGVAAADRPNFFVEALTISDARVHSEVKEIVVPPEERMLEVMVSSEKESYQPGEEAAMAVALKDSDGKPFVGSTVIAIYDRALEAIAGGSNVPEIRAFFWKWKRQHRPRIEASLARWAGNIVRSGRVAMGSLGVFGATVADEADDLLDLEKSEVSEDAATLGAPARGGGRARRSLGSPPAPEGKAARPSESLRMKSKAGFIGGDAGGEDLQRDGAPGVEPAIRKDFADSALWVGALETDADGRATVSLKMPENLTGWRIRCWGMGTGTRVGEGETVVTTRKDFMLRLQAPRFFVERDEVVLSANVRNDLKEAKKVKAILELEGETLEPMGSATQELEIPAGEERRVDWRVRAVKEGPAVVRMKALTDEESDAMQMTFPVKVHGMMKTESFSAAIRPEKTSATFEIRVPEERDPRASRLEVRWSPTLAGAMVDALPYLAEYPYGCTEQTLNRFLPAVITQGVLRDLGLDLASIKEKQANLNAQEIGDPKERAAQWRRWKRNPVFDEDELQRMVKEGVKALTAMQVSDGGWGWFSGYGERSYPHTTAVVVQGLLLAKENGVGIVPSVLDQGIAWLIGYQERELARIRNGRKDPKVKPWKAGADNLDALVHQVLCEAGKPNAAMRTVLYEDRNRLSLYGKALLGLALHKEGRKDELGMVMRNLSQFLKQDAENQTAWLEMPQGGYWWRWWGDEVEAQAYYLRLLARTDPKGEVASGLTKYLLNNRKHGSYWGSTRDTSIAVASLAEYLKASGEAEPDLQVEIWLDGKKQKEVRITKENLFAFDDRFVLLSDAVETGAHQLEIRKSGKGPLYTNAYLTIFTKEDPITKAGLEIKVTRKVYRLIREEKDVSTAGAHGQVVGQKSEKYRREELPNLATLKSGELVEVELTLESKNDYEYLIFEDLKAAGFEAVDLRSGYTRNDLGAYVEYRDDRVSFFTRSLARGRHSVSYRLRAEIPGRFSALPARGFAMYAPELKANSDEIKLAIED